MKRLGFVLVLMLAIASLLVVGCDGGEGEEATPTPTPTPTLTPTPTPTPTLIPTPTPTPTPTATIPPGELSEILGLTSAIESLKFDMAISGPGIPSVVSTVWQKPDKAKTEVSMEGQTIITYMDYVAEKMCVYFPATGMGMSMDFSMAQANPLDQAETILGYEPTIVGEETIDGKICLVFEWTTDGVHTKWWLWKAKGFPIKAVVTTPEGVTTMEFSNIEFGDIPDSEFEFPAECP